MGFKQSQWSPWDLPLGKKQSYPEKQWFQCLARVGVGPLRALAHDVGHSQPGLGPYILRQACSNPRRESDTYSAAKNCYWNSMF